MPGPPSNLPLQFDRAGFDAGHVMILKDISITLTAGPPTVLIGPNGAGKTTFLRAAMGLIAPTQGRVTWAGSGSLPPLTRAFVFQRPVMLRRSVDGNVRYALATSVVPESMWPTRTAELLALVGLEGLQGRPARRLSGGEQQRLAIARALARDPEVLFLDEPTASLDPPTTKTIEDVIRAAASHGTKVVMATHDLAEARRLAGDVVFLHRGCIIESGPANVFFAGPRTVEAQRFVAGELLV